MANNVVNLGIQCNLVTYRAGSEEAADGKFWELAPEEGHSEYIVAKTEDNYIVANARLVDDKKGLKVSLSQLVCAYERPGPISRSRHCDYKSRGNTIVSVSSLMTAYDFKYPQISFLISDWPNYSTASVFCMKKNR